MAMLQVPAGLVSRDERVVRPRDLADTYVNPTSELSRLETAGAVVRVARGYYAVVPVEFMGAGVWRPTIESLALGVAVVDYGADRVALMGPSAARLHGAMPRAVAEAAVATPKQRPPLETRFGRIRFHRRRVERLDLERVDTELARGYQTTVEQTLLDLARWGDAWDTSADMIVEAIQALSARADWSLVRDIALEQGERLAYVRATRVAGGIAKDAPQIRFRGEVSPKGILPSGGAPGAAVDR